MTLTGKAKQDFEKWMNPNPLEHGRFGQLFTNTFNAIPSSAKYGVFVDWFDSVSMTETVELELSIIAGGYNRQEARLWAIQKQNERYNRNKT